MTAAGTGTEIEQISAHASSPEQEYLQRREAREQALARHTRLDMMMSHARTATALTVILLGWLAFGARAVAGWWILAPIGLFVVLMAAHERIIQRKQRAERAVAYYDDG